MTSLKKLLPALALGIAAIPAFAGDEPALDKADTAWIMVAGLLVLFMTIPGIALFYAGMVRKKNMLSTLAQSVAICGLMSILWYAVGYSLAFSEGTPFIGGLSKAFLSGISISTLSGSIPELLFVFFQMTFAILTPALITGSLAERMKFSSLCVFMVAWSLLVYAPICHWVWASDGFFFQMGALDYAGGTVVHINAGIAGLVACLMLGRRTGYGSQHLAPANLTFAMIGACLLWFGWMGFNGGDGDPCHADCRCCRHHLLDGGRMDFPRQALAPRHDFRGGCRFGRDYPGFGLRGTCPSTFHRSCCRRPLLLDGCRRQSQARL